MVGPVEDQGRPGLHGGEPQRSAVNDFVGRRLRGWFRFLEHFPMSTLSDDMGYFRPSLHSSGPAILARLSILINRHTDGVFTRSPANSGGISKIHAYTSGSIIEWRRCLSAKYGSHFFGASCGWMQVGCVCIIFHASDSRTCFFAASSLFLYYFISRELGWLHMLWMHELRKNAVGGSTYARLSMSHLEYFQAALPPRNEQYSKSPTFPEMWWRCLDRISEIDPEVQGTFEPEKPTPGPGGTQMTGVARCIHSKAGGGVLFPNWMTGYPFSDSSARKKRPSWTSISRGGANWCPEMFKLNKHDAKRDVSRLVCRPAPSILFAVQWPQEAVPVER
ncbi:hypothetical protein B0H14DRAFT_3569207 [Mycena olivaceomarginata]|nr:hypothetical protein B0H14DRAFT_3569207 [Mycena olivaceomarginata]